MVKIQIAPNDINNKDSLCTHTGTCLSRGTMVNRFMCILPKIYYIQIKASKLVDSVPMVNTRKARPIETTEILQKCVSFWLLHSQSFISSHCNQPITQDSFQGHYSGCGGCFSCKQMLILLKVLSLQPSL